MPTLLLADNYEPAGRQLWDSWPITVGRLADNCRPTISMGISMKFIRM